MPCIYLDMIRYYFIALIDGTQQRKLGEALCQENVDDNDDLTVIIFIFLSLLILLILPLYLPVSVDHGSNFTASR